VACKKVDVWPAVLVLRRPDNLEGASAVFGLEAVAFISMIGAQFLAAIFLISNRQGLYPP